MTPSSRWIYAVSFILLSLGFLSPFWPLSLLGILLSALSGRYVFAVFVALILDIAYGAPTATVAYIYFPFTALALVASLLRHFSARFFLDRNRQETL